MKGNTEETCQSSVFNHLAATCPNEIRFIPQILLDFLVFSSGRGKLPSNFKWVSHRVRQLANFMYCYRICCSFDELRVSGSSL